MDERATPADDTWRICLAGALALAVAMGIGRFGFTPLLPLMQREGLVNADGGAALAAVNYAGYLLGALSAAALTGRPRRLVLGGLLATAALTAGAGAVSGLAPWLLLRGLAGVLSAWVMVGVSSWALGELARRGRAEAGGVVFAGVGVGIAAAGALAWWRAGDGAAALWWQLGLLALAATAVIALCWRPSRAASPITAAPPATRAPLPRGSTGLIVCYACFGFGYILPATYLPALARALVDDPQRFGIAWPVFGIAAAISTLLAARALRRWRQLDVWAACHLLLAVGTVAPLLGRSVWMIGFAALCVGGSFMVATMAGLQQARRLAPAHPAPLLGRMTAAFALGQIAGPLVALAWSRAPLPGLTGIESTLALAALLLCASAAWLHYRQENPHVQSEALAASR
ncbi:YbfB/YjiJ family MFS transporter [Aquincola sp. S2]|uniref:YbfB/YjiJ family MFS transporter n=1 Tax=Pseudaquabacterium terrae TaxID=2732868 RepID=A0ABX2EK28_9BURK|nr:YbfB/YjiJ family MFS transporter [Aquabacterium terrae]NRF68963.1 YbfB/YjiJ family MFS transporter [Aquabacterium terrae]